MSFKDLKYKKKERENSIQKINDFTCNTFATHCKCGVERAN